MPAHPLIAALVVGALLAAGCGRGELGGDWKPGFFEDCPYWSSDGSAVAAGRHPSVGSDEQPGIRVYDTHGDTLRRLTTDDLRVVAWPAGRRELVAFDGRELVFVAVRDGRRRPFMNIASRLPEARDADVLPSPALDSALVSFQRPSSTDDPLDYRDEIWVVDRKTGTATMVSRPDSKFASNPSWSPDGTWIAYDDLDHIYLVRRDGASHRVVPTAKYPTGAVFSPDGKALAYGARDGVFRVDLAWGRSRLLVPGEDQPAAWSRDGRRLLLLSLGGVTVIDATTGAELARFPEFGGTWPGTGVYCPAFSPDGGRVAFLRSWPGSFGGGASALYLAPDTLDEPRSIDPAGR